MSAKDLKSLLASNLSLAGLAQRAAAMQSLRATIADGLSQELAEHIVDVSVNDRQALIVVTHEPAWAARLRFHSADMLSLARRSGVPATHCQIKVRPATQTQETDRTPAPPQPRQTS